MSGKNTPEKGSIHTSQRLWYLSSIGIHLLSVGHTGESSDSDDLTGERWQSAEAHSVVLLGDGNG